MENKQATIETIVSELKETIASTVRADLTEFGSVVLDFKIIILKPLAGRTFDETSNAAYSIALRTGKVVRLRFNGVEITMLNHGVL